MPTCPEGHDSGTADYCDQCGAQIGGAPAASATDAPASHAPAGTDEVVQACPQCGAARTGRFCEADGYDFVAADLGGQPAGTGTPHATAPGDDSPVAGDGSGPTLAESAGSGDVGSAGVGSADVAATHEHGPRWVVSIASDAEYHERVQAMGGPDADAMSFPQFCPQRQFQLAGTELLIGRRSRTRGIEPQIDLTGPPEDPGVSHSHALLIPGQDGAWAVVDLDSSNGTYLNGSTDPLAPNTPVPLGDGDRIHVGAWTTLTVSAAR